VSFLNDSNGNNLNTGTYSPAEAVPASAGGAHRRGVSNTASEKASKSKENVIDKLKKLLRFGLDWLTVNLMRIGSSDCIAFLDSVFAHYDPEEVFTGVRDITWIGTDHRFIVKFRKSKGDIFAYFKVNNDTLICVHKITSTTTFRGLSQFQYRLEFYGSIFALDDLGNLSFEDYITPFIKEVDSGVLLAIVSGIHICADIENVTTDWVDKGIKRLSKKLKKASSRINQDPKTGLYETVYFGTKNNGARGKKTSADWFVRSYDKLKEIRDNGHERLYPTYLTKESVTRIEAVFNSAIFRKNEVSLKQCLNQGYLFALFSKFLRSKDVCFRSVKFIESELKKGRLDEVVIEKLVRESVPLSQEKKVKSLQSRIRTVAGDFGISQVEFLEELLKEAKGESSALLVW